jgi:hypothetical protein
LSPSPSSHRGAAVGAGPQAVGKPDLVVTRGQVSSISGNLSEVTWFLRDVRYSLTWKAQTKNAGAVAAATSQTGLRYQGAGGRWVLFDRSRVPRLAPNHVHQGVEEFRYIFDSASWDLGTYPVEICADVTHAVAEKAETTTAASSPTTST